MRFPAKAVLSAFLITAASAVPVMAPAATTTAAAPDLALYAQICERTRFKRSEITRLQEREDFVSLLNYSLANCPVVAEALTSGATATVRPVSRDNDNDDRPGSEAKPEKPKTEEPRTEKPRTEKPRTEKPRTEEPRTEKPRTEKPRTEKPRTEKPRT